VTVFGNMLCRKRVLPVDELKGKYDSSKKICRVKKNEKAGTFEVDFL